MSSLKPSLCGLAAAVAGCGGNPLVEVTSFSALSATNGACSAAGSPQLTAGILDLQLASLEETGGFFPGYVVGVTVTSHADSKVASLQEVEAKYQFVPGLGGPEAAIPTRTFPVSAVVAAGATASFTQQILSDADLPTLESAQDGTLIVTLTFFGTVTGGGAIELPAVNSYRRLQRMPARRRHVDGLRQRGILSNQPARVPVPSRRRRAGGWGRLCRLSDASSQR